MSALPRPVMCAGVLAAALALSACGPQPASFAECASLDDATAREDCRLRFGQQLLDDPQALDAVLADLDPGSRDLLLLRLAVADPPRAGMLCRKVASATAEEKCKQVLGRPHLSTTPRSRQPPPEQAPAPQGE